MDDQKTDPLQRAELLRRIAALEAENAELRSHARASAAHEAGHEDRQILEVLNRTGTALAAELNLERLVQIVTDAGVELVGAAFGAFFYNTSDERGEKYMLYALSGVPHSAFDKFPMPKRTAIFAPTFDGTAIVRSDDITQDPRYGQSEPYRGMPNGHVAVRSYLGVPVISRTKEVLGALFFGHPEPGKFTKKGEQFIVGIAAQAAIAIENARLLQDAQKRERRFRALVEHGVDGIAVIDEHNNIQYLSPAVAAIEGYSAEELTGGNGINNTHPDDLQLVQDTVRRATENPGVPIPVTWRRRHKDGRWLWLEGVATDLRNDPAVRGIVTNYRDITQRVRAEEIQIRSQKMEALGTLAGGIAHDFNNILLAIRGNAALAGEDLPADHPSQSSIEEINKASQRATELVRRILSFSRQQESRRELVLLSNVVQEALNLLRATLPAMIDITTSFMGGELMVLADSTQIHQLVMNIMTNAAHAIADNNPDSHGTIEVTIDSVAVTPELSVSTRELPPGEYVRLTISDTGCGMDNATLQRIFDPFFTTKPVGQGTGLGLSVAHGIMKAHDGAVTVYSQPSKGSTFRLYFPVAAGQRKTLHRQQRAIARGHGEHVLYVDDDEALVRLTTRVLDRLGYRVSGFTHPQKAIAAFGEHPQEYDVVVTDLSMPAISGFELARAIRELRADIPILMTSGYVRPSDRLSAGAYGIRDFILKPNTAEDIGNALNKLFTELGSKNRT